MPHLMNCSHSCEGWCIPCVKEMHEEFERKIESLELWKSCASHNLGQWDEVWEAAGKPGQLGSLKPVETKAEVERMRERIAQLEGLGPLIDLYGSSSWNDGYTAAEGQRRTNTRNETKAKIDAILKGES